MASLKKIEERTERFIAEYDRLSNKKGFPTHDNLAIIIGAKGGNTITEILGKRQNIQPEQWEKFAAHFGINTDKSVVHKDHSKPLNNTHDKYIELLEGNDQFFKNEYAQLLLSLNKLIDLGMKQEALIKLSLQHVGVVEALQKGSDVDEVQAQINSQIAEIGPYGQKDNDDDK